MAEEKKESAELHEYAGGWMTERKGTDVPIFLKVVSPIIATEVPNQSSEKPSEGVNSAVSIMLVQPVTGST